MKIGFHLLIGLSLVLVGTSFIGVDPEQKKFDIHDYAWLSGTWLGDGFGGTSEETWGQPASDGTMMGMYRHFKSDGTMSFCEFWILNEKGIRLKHFNPDLVGWEEKEDYITFEMVAFSPERIEMDGLIYERKSANEMQIQLKLKRGDREETEIFNMTRK